MSEDSDNEILEMLHTWTRSLSPELAAFIRGLGTLEPDIRPLIAEHIHDYDEILPSLLMADIARWTSRTARENADPAVRLDPLLTRLEQAWGDGQNAVSDLIATSFVENVYDQPEVVRLLGPKLTRYYRIYTGQAHADASEKRPIPKVVKQIARKLRRS
ncbi:DUF7674 family protein [Nocardia jiangxiensis]|uniref:DUF7674 domain-containing protein n=1 Tax=Nocardia jiangxiensis TaxID=282685 RepID=A0ABW6RY95_9NOCA|nr:hypothetical protein [Nocardia jiangxiensis]